DQLLLAAASRAIPRDQWSSFVVRPETLRGTVDRRAGPPFGRVHIAPRDGVVIGQSLGPKGASAQSCLLSAMPTPRRAGRGCEFPEPSFDEAPLGAVIGQVPRAPVGGTRLVGPPEASQEFGPGRVQVAEVVELEPVDDAQAGLGAV